MTVNIAEDIYKQIKRRGDLRYFNPCSTVPGNIITLEKILIELNIAKSSIAEIDTQHQGAPLYLLYLIQSNDQINFNLCPMFKMWENKYGWQYRCNYDKGKNAPIKVSCKANPVNCQRKDQYNSLKG